MILIYSPRLTLPSRIVLGHEYQKDVKQDKWVISVHFANLSGTKLVHFFELNITLKYVTMNQQALLDDDQAVLGLFDKYCEL